MDIKWEIISIFFFLTLTTNNQVYTKNSIENIRLTSFIGPLLQLNVFALDNRRLPCYGDFNHLTGIVIE